MAKGTISVNSENIFPIIKKWLYSDKDIFLRELVSNGCDAITKLKKLAGIGEAELEDNEELRIDVTLDPEQKKLIISDNGIGMTEEEVTKYITDIAFSGATDFLEKYKDQEAETAQIIGHFGLGFYSAFMVADCVEIDTLSYQPGAAPVKWVCDGDMDYEMEQGSRQTRGTTITLTLAEDSQEFSEEHTLRSVLNKYCSFLPTPIYFDVTGKEAPAKTEDGKEAEPIEPKPVNDTNPLWMRKPSDCTDEEYKEFYTKVFADFNPPLFWIHLNVDYPFNLKGILYFPKINHELALNEGQIKLFNNQVFVADNVKEVIPEFLMLLKGVIDCPDLPLNVSRSFLQNDSYVKKISAHITKKIADKLVNIYKNDRENYNTYWEDINIFIKYGCLRDEKFYDKVKDILIFKTTKGGYITLDEYLEGKETKDVYYVSDPKQQAQYINLFEQQGLDAVLLPSVMDTHFISFIEMKQEGVKFKRIDSALSNEHMEEDAETDEEKKNALIDCFKKHLCDDTLKYEVQALKDLQTPAVLLLSEQSRRMQEMYRSYGQQMAGMANMFPDEYTLVLNSNNPLIQKLEALSDENAELVTKHIYDLATISNKPLGSEQMTAFIARSNEILQKIL